MKKIIVRLFAFFLIVHCTLNIENCNAQWVQMSNGINSNSISNNKNYFETSIIIDTNALKYFPLAVGNVYKYHYGSSGGYIYNYKIRIIKDTIINSKKYFIVNQLFPGYIGNVLRLDSASGNIYSRSGTGYCTYSPFEELIDSLRSKKGDTTLVCTSYIRHYCVDTSYNTLFGNSLKSKSFSRNASSVTWSIVYGIDFGIIHAMYSDPTGLASESLIGCYINGILYGDTTLTDIEKISSEIPSSYSLSQNYPNPFNPATKIRFTIPRGSPIRTFGDDNGGSDKVVLKIYDILGKEIETLVNEKLQPGTYEVTFNASQYPSGVYFYRLHTEKFNETKKMILLK